APRLDDLVAVALEVEHEQVPDIGLVLDDQDSERGHAPMRSGFLVWVSPGGRTPLTPSLSPLGSPSAAPRTVSPGGRTPLTPSLYPLGSPSAAPRTVSPGGRTPLTPSLYPLGSPSAAPRTTMPGSRRASESRPARGRCRGARCRRACAPAAR